MKKYQINKLLIKWGYRAMSDSGNLIAFNKIRFLFIGGDNNIEDIIKMERCKEGIILHIQIYLDEDYVTLIHYSLDDDIEHLKDWINFGIYNNEYYVDNLCHVEDK